MRPLGLEPRTCGLRVRCSAIELEAQNACRVYERVNSTGNVTGRGPRVTDGTRTRDSQYHKLELYQLSYGHHVGPTVCHNARRVPPTSQGVADGAIDNGFRRMLGCCRRDP